MKKTAFTLAELLITIMLIGTISVAMLRNVKSSDFKDRTNIAKAYKAIDIFDQASSQIRDVESEHCPIGQMLYKTGVKADGTYDYEIGVINSKGETVSAAELLEIYSEHIKFEKTGFSFCTYSPYCNTAGYAADKVSGAKLPGDIYIGLYVDGVKDCPDFYLPEVKQIVTVRNDFKTKKKPQCWAKLLVDTNGLDQPNALGKDIFVYGIDALGVHH
ncbi:MAG: type II secretion system protein [Candidatus Gastranaerophilales bacterium]|nr:type II secretion system protein [Candidatus Gastranaerophilales bacterium]